MHSLFGFYATKKGGFNNADFLIGSSDQKLETLRPRFKDNSALLILDEISTIGCYFIGRIDKMCGEITGNSNEAFGNKSVLIVGDLFQFPPVIPKTPIYQSVVKMYGPQKVATAKKNKSANITNSAELQGTKLFVTFQKFELTQQVRAAGDPQHVALINAMRQCKPDMQTVVKKLEKNYKIFTAQVLRDDPKFAFCPILTTGNIERIAINEKQSKYYDIFKELPRIVWQDSIYGTGITSLLQDEIDKLNISNRELTNYFIYGAPACLTDNITPSQGLSNGTRALMHSLILNEEEDGQHIIDQLANASPGQDIFLDHQPQYVNVSVPDLDPADFVGKTLVEGQVVIPISREFERTIFKGFVGRFPQKIEYYSKKIALDLQFAKTLHKVIGQTLERIVVDLNDRSFQPKISFHGLFVALSRVKTSKHICFMPHQPGSINLQHLASLQPPKDLVTLLNSYDEMTGYIDFNKLSHLPSQELEITSKKVKKIVTAKKPRSSYRTQGNKYRIIYISCEHLILQSNYQELLFRKSKEMNDDYLNNTLQKAKVKF